MTCGVHTLDSQLGLSWCSRRFQSLLLTSREFLALRWSMSGTILGELASRSDFTWRLRLPTCVWGGGTWMG
jgi:hypothetical protein